MESTLNTPSHKTRFSLSLHMHVKCTPSDIIASVYQPTVPGTKWGSRTCSPALQPGRELSLTSPSRQAHTTQHCHSFPRTAKGLWEACAQGSTGPEECKGKAVQACLLEEKLLAKYKISEFFFLSGITHKIKF